MDATQDSVPLSKHHFSKVEFYITNVCNLNCNGCNRFNDYNFTGWQRWSDYEVNYQNWSKYIDMDHIVILGGEPLLNPSIIDWIYGLKKTFVTTKWIQILSNGTRLTKVKGLYNALKHTSDPGPSIWLGISWHNQDNLSEVDQEIRAFLEGDNIRIARGIDSNPYGADIVYTDSNGVSIPIWMQDNFYPSAIVPTNRGTLTLHNNDPIEAHSKCPIAQYKSYHFIKAKLYKCGPVALFPEFDQQHNLDITNEDRILLNSYQPLTDTDYTKFGADFISNLDQPLAQCKFCSVDEETKQIFSIKKNLVQF
jgi:hypothetical protein